MKDAVRGLVVLAMAMFCMSVQAQQSEEPISLNFTNTEIEVVVEVMRGLRPDMTVVVDRGVSGLVNVDIKDLPWETALRLIVEPNGYVLDKESDTIFRISVAKDIEPASEIEVATVNESVSSVQFEIYDKNELENVSLKVVKQLLVYKEKNGLNVKNESELREQLATSDVIYLKNLDVTGELASDVMMKLSKEAGLSYTVIKEFSTDEQSEVQAYDDGSIQAPVFEEKRVTMSINNIGLLNALHLIAKRGGFRVTSEYGMYTFEPALGAELEPLITETFRIQYLKVNDELISPLQSLLSSRGSLQLLGRKVLLVKDTANNIEKMKKAIAAVDLPIPQVQIEIRFFEINRSNSLNVGFDWTQPLTNPHQAIDGNFVTNQSISNVVGNTTMSNGAVVFNNINAVLQAYERESFIKNIANPKVVIASDEQARIHIGRSIPMVKVEAEAGESGTPPAYSIELDEGFGSEAKEPMNLLEGDSHMPIVEAYKGYLDLGTILTVAPSVKNEEDIYIKLVPELTNVNAEGTNAFTFVFTDAAGDPIDGSSVTFPEINRTTVYSEFMIKSGQTAAIGGLIKDDVVTVDDGVPYLKEIPYLGFLFSYISKTVVKNEVVIFVTANIIKPGELNVKSGIPTTAFEVQSTVDDINANDALGAEYNEHEAIDSEPKGFDDVIRKAGNRVKELIEEKISSDDVEVDTVD